MGALTKRQYIIYFQFPLLYKLDETCKLENLQHFHTHTRARTL